MRPEPRIRVSALLRWHGSILLCRHEKRGRENWLLPCGGLRSGETLVEALHRELAEETGLVREYEELPVTPELVQVDAECASYRSDLHHAAALGCAPICCGERLPTPGPRFDRSGKGRE